MASSTNFSYETITSTDPQIRLLNVLPGSSTIRCEVYHVSLSSKPNYEALSYCWGTSTGKKRIVINGSNFLVTRNLHDGLKRLRLKDKPRTLWIDAICINQDSVDEKNLFVPMMRDIYQGSRRVIIWLGDHDSRTKSALEILEFVASQYDELLPGQVSSSAWKRLKRGQNPQNSTFLTDLRDQYEIFDAIRTLGSVLKRSWFERIWTIQELVLSTDALVVCGRFQINWDTISRAELASNDGLRPGDTVEYLVELKENWREGKGSWVLLEIMMKIWYHGVTDEKDRIYGLLGLVPPHHHLVIPVEIDYGADTGHIFAEFTKNSISTTKTLDVLSLCSGYKESRWPGIPSWALHCRPDPIMEPDPEHSPGCSLGARMRSFNAGTWPLKTFEFSADGKSLGLVGLELDIITGVSAVFPNPRKRKTVDSIFGLIKANIMEDVAFIYAYLDAKRLWKIDASQIYLPDGQSIHDAFRLTIFGLQHRYYSPSDVGEEQNSRADFKYLDDLSTKVRDWENSKKMVWPRLRKILIPEYLTVNSALEDIHYRSSLSSLRRGMLSNLGYIGLGPRETEVGDRIVLLQGSRVPMVVRQVAQRLRIVGECYVHGVMDGEAFDESKAGMMWFD
ncbi:heterokaryon incompatibility protein-domain-containing protein [Nemania sp. FL0031]|nr:heterokaryon incompatibility protein-domain-containing protein [Nemania sp. FL0031]